MALTKIQIEALLNSSSSNNVTQGKYMLYQIIYI